ncbi:hypothetical protein [Streptomyces sannanensis]|uniref:hypothetical protein n=1 Tax=Streptomyces sannanensis TaxID=285536 RepID=UPI0031EAFA14
MERGTPPVPPQRNSAAGRIPLAVVLVDGDGLVSAADDDRPHAGRHAHRASVEVAGCRSYQQGRCLVL